MACSTSTAPTEPTRLPTPSPGCCPRRSADPFAPEVVAVPTRGMERWLTQRMSAVLGARPGHADGICANVVFPSPHRLVTDAVAAASGIDPAEDPWLPERAVWPLLDVVEECLGEPWLATLAAYLAPAPARLTRVAPARAGLTTVRHLAGLFDRYALHRPEMLAAWARGEDVGAPAPATGGRRVAGRAVAPAAGADRRARPGRAPDPGVRAPRDEPGLLELPARLSLFGLTRLPAGHLQVLRALATRRDVHLFLLHPSPVAVGEGGTPHGELNRPMRPRRTIPRSTLADQPAARVLGPRLARDAARAERARRGARGRPPPVAAGAGHPARPPPARYP